MDIYQRIGLVCRLIPQGKVATYGQIALLCGKPKHARQVGYALKHGLAGKQVPAYRVVNARGILSGAASFETFDQQKTFLEGDGIVVKRTDAGWQVDLKTAGWNSTLEDALWLEAQFQKAGI